MRLGTQDMSINASVIKIEWKTTVKWEVQHLLMFLFDFLCSYYKMFREVRAP